MRLNAAGPARQSRERDPARGRPPTPVDPRRLQSTLGNQAVGRLAGRARAGAGPAVIQRVPTFAEVTWRVTHLVRKLDGSIFGRDPLAGEIGRRGQLVKGQRILIEDQDVFVSRRGRNQEDPAARERDRSSAPAIEWYRVLSVNGRDLTGLNVYIRAGTFRRSTVPPAADQGHDVYWILSLVERLLDGIRYRVGGSLGARLGFGAPRRPNDIDLEFWSYADAQRAAARLSGYAGDETASPHVAYFSRPEEEEGVSITVMAMGRHEAGRGRPVPLVTIELNNENARQGSRDFKKTPDRRHRAQPPAMRRNSLIAGVLERYSYTKLLGEEDDKQDAEQLRHLVDTAPEEELATMRDRVMARFDAARVRNPPPVQDEGTGLDGDEERDDERPVDHVERMALADEILRRLIDERRRS